TGMLFTPAPARPSALMLAPKSISCRSCERTRITSGERASFTSEYCSGGRRLSPTCAIWLITSTSVFFLAMPPFELLHVLDEALHALCRHRVVDGGAHA